MFSNIDIQCAPPDLGLHSCPFPKGADLVYLGVEVRILLDALGFGGGTSNIRERNPLL